VISPEDTQLASLQTYVSADYVSALPPLRSPDASGEGFRALCPRWLNEDVAARLVELSIADKALKAAAGHQLNEAQTVAAIW
jgi:hypothetical protein